MSRCHQLSLQFTSSPICCPSRASILTGRYAHNTQTFNNSKAGGCYSNEWVEKHEPTSFPARLKQAGYETFFAGKYLNEYYSEQVPVGFDSFFGLHGNSKYYNYTLNENGKLVKYGEAADEYLTTVVKVKGLEFIKQQSSAKPFFAMFSVPSAHAPFTPEEKFKDFYKNATIPRTKNFNVGAKPFKKHWLMTMEPETLSEKVIDTIDNFYHRRLETLLSVDDLVEEIVQQLSNQKILDETYIVFTSDNGYHLGQFAMPFDKRLPYETDIRVPLIVRGPNVPANVTLASPVLLIDLAPTILNWAKAPTNDEDFDGQSFDSFLIQEEKGVARQMLIEYWGEGNSDTYSSECHYRKSQRLSGCTLQAECKCQDSWNNTYSCVREITEGSNFIFCMFRDREEFQEAYDLESDEQQLENIGFDILPSMQAHYQIMIENLQNCAGTSCRVLR